MLFGSLSQHIRTSGARKSAQRHFDCNDPNETIFNFCSALSSQFEASNNQMVSLCKAGKCALPSQWARVSTDCTWTHGEGEAVVSVHWLGFGCLCASSFPGMELGDELMDMPGSGGAGGSRHTQTQQFAGFPAAALCYR